MRHAHLVLAALLGAACTTTTTPDDRPLLPFHVALAPISAASVRTDLRPGASGEATDMRFASDALLQERLTQAVAQALRKRAFHAVTVLTAPQSDAQDAASAVRRDAGLLSSARDKGADLLLLLELELQPVVRQEKNDYFWANFPLFLLGGPFCWWVGDRSYFVDAEVTAWFYDTRIASTSTTDATLRTTREVATASRRAERIDLDFMDRAQGDAGDYLISMVWPCGFLAVESDDLETELNGLVLDQLGEGLARSVLDQSAELERGGPPFFLDLARSGIVQSGTGPVLRGVVRLHVSRQVEALEGWRIRIGEAAPPPHSFASGPPPEEEGADLIYRFEQPLSDLKGATHVRLEVESDRRSGLVRSYTFRVPSSKAATTP